MTPLALVTSAAVGREDGVVLDTAAFTLRTATDRDAASIHALIVDHQAEGHLLPRSLSDVQRHAERFVVIGDGRSVVGCGELAPLGCDLAEIRSLVVARAARGHDLGERIFGELKSRAERLGLARLCVFTHEPRYFMRLGFSIVPHTWMPEKIAADCCTCPLFRRCGQFGMVMDLMTPRTERAWIF